MTGVVGALAIVTLAACNDKLVVTDLNAPDQTRALASAADVENLLTTQFRNIWNNEQGYVIGMEMQMECLGMESASTLGNAEAGRFCGLPRVPDDNSRGNASYLEKYNPYLYIYRAVRSVAIGLNQMYQPGFTFVPADNKETARDFAYGYFEMGVGLGDIALVYDSGAVVKPGDNLNGAAPPFVGPDTLMAVALAYLDSAIAYAAQNPAVGNNGWPTPSTWINGQSLSAAAFTQLARSYKARFRAGLARTPAARAAVNWAAVIADAQAGIQSDFILQITPGPPLWQYDPSQMFLFAAWHQMWQYMVGMADTSTAAQAASIGSCNYSGYLANQANCSPFLVVTPDKRFPAGTTRALQNTASGCSGSNCIQPPATAPYPYLRNRLSGNDSPAPTQMQSEYDFYRFEATLAAQFTGPIVIMAKAEMNGLIAEGYIRANNVAAALPYINPTRQAAGLPALTMTDTTTRVPGTDGVAGSQGCVPKIPDPATNYLSAKCGNVWEAMKWEKRMETAYTHWGAWFTDGRGWGDLPQYSILEYPTPYQELDTRQHPLYSTSAQAPNKGTYGL
jgi:hypothetical protein